MTLKPDIRVYRTLEQLKSLQVCWEQLRAHEERSFPNFQDTENFLRESGVPFCVIAMATCGSITTIALFVNNNHGTKEFGTGKRVFFRLPVRVITLYGYALLATCSPADGKAILHLIAKEWPHDLIRLGEIVIDTPFYKAAKNIGGGLIAARKSKNSIHWLTKLPKSFDEFMKGLRSTTRNTVTRKLKRFQRECNYQFEIVSRLDQVEKFLADGEKISRVTYQWDIGQKLVNDECTRLRYARLANSNRLRCYLLYIDKTPCAFLRGSLDGAIYTYETPGFDPEFTKLSPGIVLLMWAIKDLIENTDCKVFDFGEGGGVVGYKASFGNYSYTCTYLEIYNLHSPYSFATWVLHSLFEYGKSVARLLVRRVWS